MQIYDKRRDSYLRTMTSISELFDRLQDHFGFLAVFRVRRDYKCTALYFNSSNSDE